MTIKSSRYLCARFLIVAILLYPVTISSLASPTVAQEELRHRVDFDGHWRITFDRAIDHRMDDKCERLDLRIAFQEGKLIGRRIDDGGKVHDAVSIRGAVYGDFPPLVTLIQREANLTRSFQVCLNLGRDEVPRGTWVDTTGARGDFTLQKLQ